MAAPAAVLEVLVTAKGIDKVHKEVKGLDEDLDKAGKSGHKSMGLLKTAAGALAGVAVFDGLKKGIGAAIDEYQEARKVGAQTNAVLKSTGGAANVTAKQIGALATSISRKAGIDDEAIQTGENLLLTFKGIRNEAGKGNDIFNQTTQVVTDVSAALGQDMKSSAIQVGKALNDPIKGVTALQRVGVSFTEKQKAQIATLVKTGHTMDAQKLILRELNSEFAGSAAAAATPLDKLKVSAGNLAEAAGGVLVPALDKGATLLGTFLDQMQTGQGVGGVVVKVFRTLGEVIVGVVKAIIDVVHWFKEHHTAALALGAALGVVLAAFAGFTIVNAVRDGIMALRAAMLALNTAFLANPAVLAVAALAALAAAFVVAYKKSQTFRDIVDGVFGVVKDIVGGFADFFTKTIPGAVSGVVGFVKDHWPFIIGALGGPVGLAVAAIATHLDDIVGFFKALPGRLVDALKATPGALIDAGKWLLNRIVDGFKTVGDLLSSVGGWLKNRFVDMIHAEIDGWKAIGSWVLNRIVDGFKTVGDLLGTVGGWLKNRFVDLIHAEVAGFGAVGSWVLNRVVDGFKTVTDGLGSAGGWIKNRFTDLIHGVGDDFKDLGGFLINKIVEGLKGGANLLIGFLNDIIGAINIIPGVDISKVKKLAEGGTFGKATGPQGTGHLARGGAFGVTGGLISSPITMMGEEAPMHPEFVIPTNPAYRSRAQDLLAQAAGVIGLASGGVHGKVSTFGPPTEAAGTTASGVSSALPGIAIYDRSTLGKIFDVVIGAHKATLKQTDIGPAPWTGRVIDVTGAGARAMGLNPFTFPTDALGSATEHKGGGGILGAIGHALSGAAGAVGDLLSKGAGFILDKLPGVGDLPDWLKATGHYALDKAKDYITGKVKGLIGAGGGGGVPSGVSGSINGAIAFAQKLGFAHPSLNQLTGGQHAPNSYHYQGRAADFGAAGHSVAQMKSLFAALLGRYGSHIKEMFYDPEGYYIKNGAKVGGAIGGHSDHLHLALAKGGMFGGLPYAGSFAGGGIVPGPAGAPRSAVVHGGEMIGTPEIRVFIGERELTDIVRVEIGERDRQAARTYRAGASA